MDADEGIRYRRVGQTLLRYAPMGMVKKTMTPRMGRKSIKSRVLEFESYWR